MPLYEYECAACGERTEKMRSLADRAKGPACPECGEATALALSVPGRAAVSGGSRESSALPTMDGGGCGCGPGGCGVNLN